MQNTQPTEQRPVRSASAVAALRAASAGEPDSSVRNPDYMARHFASGAYAMALRLPNPLLRRLLELRVPGAYCYFLARTRFIDEIFEGAIARGVRQFVLLGAGFDTRAHRFRDRLDDARVFEVDLPAMQRRKLAVLERSGVELNDRVYYGSHDFREEALGETLVRMGFDAGLPALFVLEGVSYYLSPPDVRRILALVSGSSGAGSEIVFDYSVQSFLDGDVTSYGARQMARWLRRNNEPFLFGLDAGSVDGYLRAFDLRLHQHLDSEVLTWKYLVDRDGRLLGRPLGYLNLVHARSEGGAR